ncbi:MAG: magnesium transporter [Planctomycetota bacterium]|nr:MAG: magnesium transporter [Planctomycetota bacterium]
MKEPNALTLLLVPDIRLALQNDDEDFIQDVVCHLHAADLADILESLEEGERTAFFQKLPPQKKVETMEHLEEPAELILLLPQEEVIPIIESMSSDDRADMIKSLPEEFVESLLPKISLQERNDIKKLIAYPEGTAGAIMTTEYLSLPAHLRVEEALVQIRSLAPQRETIYYMYVVDSEGHLKGHLSLRDLVLADPEQRLQEIMNPNVIAMHVFDDQEKVAQAIQKYDFLAIPILDRQERLVGIVTHDDVLDVLEVENTEDAHKMAAVSPLEDAYMETPFWLLVRKRVFWLSLLFIGEMFTSSALSHFEHVLESYIVLVFFIPLIISAGGNAGSQSSTLIVRDMSVGEIGLRDWFVILLRESKMGMVMGALLGILGLGRALLLGTDAKVALIVMLTIMLVVTLGVLVGSGFPLIFRKLGLDPAVTSSPFVASVVDVVGIVIYFLVARAVLGI